MNVRALRRDAAYRHLWQLALAELTEVLNGFPDGQNPSAAKWAA